MIETERLLIRPLEPDDAHELFPLWGAPANHRFGFGLDPPASVAELRRWLERDAPWGVWERETGALVGDCGVFYNGDAEYELAYGFRRDRWGRGDATEAGAACVQHAFAARAIDRIVAEVHVTGHPASPRVLAKLGFRPSEERDDKIVFVLARSSGTGESRAGAPRGWM